MKQIYDGAKYVAERIQWYSNMTDNVLRDTSTQGNEQLEKARQQLESGMLSLYESLIFYQIKSVCFYYKNQGYVFVRAFFNLDDWDGSIDGIKAQETP